MMANRYSKMTTEDFDRLLAQVIDDQHANASDLLTVPGIYGVLSEYYNNEVLTAWDVEQAEQAEEQNTEEDIPE